MPLTAHEIKILAEIEYDCTDERDPEYMDTEVTRKLEEIGFLMVFANRTKMSVTCAGARFLVDIK